MSRYALLLLLACLAVGLSSVGLPLSSMSPTEAASDFTQPGRFGAVKVEPLPPEQEYLKAVKEWAKSPKWPPPPMDPATSARVFGYPLYQPAPPAQTPAELMVIALDKRFYPEHRIDAILKLGTVNTQETPL